MILRIIINKTFLCEVSDFLYEILDFAISVIHYQETVDHARKAQTTQTFLFYNLFSNQFFSYQYDTW